MFLGVFFGIADDTAGLQKFFKKKGSSKLPTSEIQERTMSGNLNEALYASHILPSSYYLPPSKVNVQSQLLPSQIEIWTPFKLPA